MGRARSRRNRTPATAAGSQSSSHTRDGAHPVLGRISNVPPSRVGLLPPVLPVTDTAQANQISNVALAEWADCEATSGAPTADYVPAIAEGFSADERMRMWWHHLLPDRRESMIYCDFLQQRPC